MAERKQQAAIRLRRLDESMTRLQRILGQMQSRIETVFSLLKFKHKPALPHLWSVLQGYLVRYLRMPLSYQLCGISEFGDYKLD